MACSAGAPDPTASSALDVADDEPVVIDPELPAESPAELDPPAAVKQVTAAHVSYHGGPLLQSAQVSVLYWNAGVNSQIRSTLPGFYSTVMGGAYFDWLAEYNAGGMVLGHGSFVGAFVDPSPPSNGPGVPISQAQLESELARLIGNVLPAAGPNSLYMVYFPPDVSLTAGGWFSCTPSDGFCGFHNRVTLPNGQAAYYGVIPDLGVCGSRCGPSDQVGNTTSTSSHELVEAITDPADSGWRDNATGYEISDICQLTAPSTWQGTIGGYVVQKQWSNTYNACIITPPVPAYDAQFVSQSVPSQILVNGTATVSLTFRNTGSQPWTEATQVRLASQHPDNNTSWGLSRVALAAGETVAAGASRTFTFVITAPATLGAATFQWRMVRDSGGVGLFGAASPLTSITVTDQPPTAAFTASCSNRQCTFNGAGSSDREGALSYAWSFGDGSPAGAGVAPSHTYAANGTYTVTLTVTDSAGQPAQVSHGVTAVDPPPTAAFTASCAIRQCTFNGAGSSDAGGAIAAYSWSFGDGSPAATGATASHLYAVNGVYTVTLTVTDSVGQLGQISHNVAAVDAAPHAAFWVVCIDRTCSADAESSSDDVRLTNYAWSWGDGAVTSSGSASAPSHTYAGYGTFVVGLTVTDSEGQTGSTSQSVTLAAGPVPAFTVSCARRTCSFDASGTTGPSPIVGYHWDWDDETTLDATGPGASHAFGFADTFRVHLTVTDDKGRTAGLTVPVVVP